MGDTSVLFEHLINALAAGVTLGCIYGLMCTGLGLIFGVMNVVNFAQGELLMLGMYIAFYLVTGWGLLSFLGLAAPLVGAILAGPIMFVVGALIHRFLLARVSGLRTSGSLDEGNFGQLILTLGLSLVLQNGGLIVFGSMPGSVLTPLSSSAWIFETGFGDATLFLNKARVIACLVAILVGIAVYLMLERTRLGRALRAAADNATAATYMGVDVSRAHRIAFGLGSAITAVAGGLIATSLSFTPFIGIDFVIIMYAGVVLGGMGSILGAFWGGLTIGIVQQLSSLVLPTQLQNGTIFVVFLLIVILRPQGLFGRSTERA
jgi:branched-chain amino acid transport system permease protein